MIFELKEPQNVAHLFAGWKETCVYSCLQQVMGQIFVTELDEPKSAYAKMGCFLFYAGEPSRELLLGKPEGFCIMVPQNDAWAKLIEDCIPNANRYTRYAISKETTFDVEHLQQIVAELPEGYELREIDSELYDQCLQKPETIDFVSCYESKEQYLSIGRGRVILKDGEIVSGASSYSTYKEGIEIEVQTKELERRKHLASIACAALILSCLQDGLYPSWDAANMNSVMLSKKLGYTFDHEYAAYTVTD